MLARARGTALPCALPRGAALHHPLPPSPQQPPTHAPPPRPPPLPSPRSYQDHPKLQVPLVSAAPSDLGALSATNAAQLGGDTLEAALAHVRALQAKLVRGGGA